MTPPVYLMSGATGKYMWEVLPHPRHSSDLALSDYNLFSTLKDHMMQWHYKNDKTVLEAAYVVVE
jgi:hypothetical protein